MSTTTLPKYGKQSSSISSSSVLSGKTWPLMKNVEKKMDDLHNNAEIEATEKKPETKQEKEQNAPPQKAPKPATKEKLVKKTKKKADLEDNGMKASENKTKKKPTEDSKLKIKAKTVGEIPLEKAKENNNSKTMSKSIGKVVRRTKVIKEIKTKEETVEKTTSTKTKKTREQKTVEVTKKMKREKTLESIKSKSRPQAGGDNKQTKEKEVNIVDLADDVPTKEASINYDDWTGWGEEEYAGEEEIKEPRALTRNEKIIKEHKDFKAARIIQSACRGWLEQLQFERRTKAIRVIQACWRRYAGKQLFFLLLEDSLQKRTVQSFEDAATTIQCFWRGFFSRKTTHDHKKLSRAQYMAAEDLLHCVAFKLHHLLRTYQIPGIYSLRNSRCYSKIEKLLASMTFKKYNDHARLLRLRRCQQVKDARRTHKESKYVTEAPFRGPNFGKLCLPQCCMLYETEDADRKMLRILDMYEKTTRYDAKMTKYLEHKADHSDEEPEPTKQENFCADVINSLRRWNILKKDEGFIDPNVLRDPENVEQFLQEIQSMTKVAPRCHCDLKVEDYGKCSE